MSLDSLGMNKKEQGVVLAGAGRLSVTAVLRGVVLDGLFGSSVRCGWTRRHVGKEKRKTIATENDAFDVGWMGAVPISLPFPS